MTSFVYDTPHQLTVLALDELNVAHPRKWEQKKMKGFSRCQQTDLFLAWVWSGISAVLVLSGRTASCLLSRTNGPIRFETNQARLVYKCDGGLLPPRKNRTFVEWRSVGAQIKARVVFVCSCHALAHLPNQFVDVWKSPLKPTL